jgi:hypothetical protein
MLYNLKFRIVLYTLRMVEKSDRNMQVLVIKTCITASAFVGFSYVSEKFTLMHFMEHINIKLPACTP